MSDIVERLRDTGVSTGWEAVIRDAHEAADTIASLCATNERLRAVLQDIYRTTSDVATARKADAALEASFDGAALAEEKQNGV